MRDDVLANGRVGVAETTVGLAKIGARRYRALRLDRSQVFDRVSGGVPDYPRMFSLRSCARCAQERQRAQEGALPWEHRPSPQAERRPVADLSLEHALNRASVRLLDVG